MALPGPKNDGGFNQSNYDGLLAAQTSMGIKGTVVDNVVDPQARIDAIRNLATAGNQLVIGVGAEFTQGGLTVAPEFPNTTFVIVNGQTSKSVPNLYVYVIRQGVPAYVAAVIGAKMTKTKKIGYIGGELIPPIQQAEAAFKAGAKATDPSVQVFSTITGDFNDPVKAKAAASGQIADGVDFIYAFVDAGLAGIVQAIQASGKPVKMVTITTPVCGSYPTFDVGTGTINNSNFIGSIVKDKLHNSMPSGIKAYGVENPDIQSFVLCPAFAGQSSTATLTAQTISGINSGAISLPAGV